MSFDSFSPRVLLILRIIFTVCAAGTVIFILGNSAQMGEDSGDRSKKMMEILNSLLGLMDISFRFTHHLVRKLAHFSEYALLGFWLMLSLRVYTKRMLAHLSWPLFFGLLTAVCDESLQLLVPGRSGLLADVLIDFGGILFGLFIGLFLWMLAYIVVDGAHRQKQSQTQQ